MLRGSALSERGEGERAGVEVRRCWVCLKGVEELRGGLKREGEMRWESKLRGAGARRSARASTILSFSLRGREGESSYDTSYNSALRDSLNFEQTALLPFFFLHSALHSARTN